MSAMSDERNGWDEYRKYVVSELERLNIAIRDLSVDIETRDRSLRVDIAKVDRDVLTLKVKASAWGAAAGFITALIPALGRWITIK